MTNKTKRTYTKVLYFGRVYITGHTPQEISRMHRNHEFIAYLENSNVPSSLSAGSAQVLGTYEE